MVGMYFLKVISLDSSDDLTLCKEPCFCYSLLLWTRSTKPQLLSTQTPNSFFSLPTIVLLTTRWCWSVLGGTGQPSSIQIDIDRFGSYRKSDLRNILIPQYDIGWYDRP